MMYNQPLLTCRLPSQMVLINGDRDLPAPPTWGSGGFTVGETAFSSRPCTRCGPPSLAMRAPWNVSWAQEISAIGIHNSQYFLGPMNSFWGSQLRGGAARALRPPPPLPPLAFSPPLFSAAPLRSPCLHSSHLLPLASPGKPDPTPIPTTQDAAGSGEDAPGGGDREPPLAWL